MAKFKVGDIVSYIGTVHHDGEWSNMTVERITGEQVYPTSGGFFWSDTLELVSRPKPEVEVTADSQDEWRTVDVELGTYGPEDYETLGLEYRVQVRNKGGK